jgi:hypothetical protein
MILTVEYIFIAGAEQQARKRKHTNKLMADLHLFYH